MEDSQIRILQELWSQKFYEEIIKKDPTLNGVTRLPKTWFFINPMASIGLPSQPHPNQVIQGLAVVVVDVFKDIPPGNHFERNGDLPC